MGGDLQLIGEVELVVDGAPHLRLGLVAHLVRVRVRVSGQGQGQGQG